MKLLKKKEPKVAIIITTYNQKDLLEICLSSLKKKTDYKNYKVYVVDDSNNGNIGEKIKKDFPLVNVVINKRNLGFSKANNIGIKKALRDHNPDYILLLNDDTKIIEKGWLAKLIEFAEKQKNFGIGGVKIIYPDRSLQWFLKKGEINFSRKRGVRYDDSNEPKTAEVNDVIGCFFLIKRDVIDKIGFLDEKFSPAYGEETDYCLRAKFDGFKLFYFGSVKIIHHGSSSTQKIEGDYIWFVKKRNAIRLEWLNHSFPSIIKYNIIHIGSAIFSRNLLKRVRLLLKAYLENIKNFREILYKRRERNDWLKE